MPQTAAGVVAVRALCAFAARSGDLDRRFTPAPSAADGQLGHRWVAQRRGAAWQRELGLQATYRGLVVRGRADGFDPATGELEEVKTHRGPLARLPQHQRALHRAQARCYGWMLCRRDGLAALTVSVVYVDIDRQQENVEREHVAADALRRDFEALCERYLGWAASERAHRARRDAALAALRWPFGDYRAGQRTLAQAAFHAARSGRVLLAQAPTGIGKTMATLFPLLKALPGSARHAPLDKLFYLAAKTPGRRLALQALARLRGASPLQREAALPLRVLALVAREKACEHPDKACHGDSCPLARGFYDRLPTAREEALAALTAPEGADGSVREVALRHALCPYYLAQEMARWADVVVADYHYLFDGSALLHALLAENEWRAAALVDEAHNLLPRAREMYSAELHPARLMALRAALPPPLRRTLDRARQAWLGFETAIEGDFQAFDTVPGALAEALRRLASRIGDELAERPEALGGEALQAFFEIGRFLALAETLDAHGQFDASAARAPRHGRLAAPRFTLCVRNLVPAPFLAPRFAALQSAVLFSATLSPPHWQRQLLGLPATTAEIDIDSPFDAAQLQVTVAQRLSTRWRDRAASREAIARRIAAQYRAQPGNYLVFCSSHDYLAQLAAALAEADATIPQRLQARQMSEAQRHDFIDSFTAEGRQVGFAVLGGAFSEGIDLPGRRLIGAFVATLGLPQVNPVNEALRERLQQQFGDGWAFAYLYPGLQKVVQAAGRVIRSPQDRGVVHLLDERYARPEVRALLPAWWALPPLR